MKIFVFNKPVLRFILSVGIFLTLPWNIVFTQTVDDPIGDIPVGDPDYMDIKKINFRQSKDMILIEFYPNDVIPKGNQGGITTVTVFEVYLDVDNDNTTGVPLEDIGYDYKLHVDLSLWDGVSWVIEGNLYWDFDIEGNPQSQESRGRFYIHSSCLSSWRFRWMFSLISLKWTQINWIARDFYSNHWVDQVPDTGHATLGIDTTIVTDVDTISGEYAMFIYPSFFQEVMDKYEVLKAVDAGTQIESQLCGTKFHDIQIIEYNPCLQGIAWSGNPVLMGPSMWGTEPAWFLYFHELGHNFTLASVRFNQLYPGLGYISIGGDYWNFGANFIEAWATMVGLYAMRELLTASAQYQLGSDCRSNLQEHFDQSKSKYLGSLRSYEQDPDFSILNPDILDGIFLALADSFGYDIFPKFFKILQPPDQSWSLLDEIQPDYDYDWAKTLSMTVTICAFSVATGSDLRDKFINQWDFPIYEPFYEEIKPEIESIITNVFEKQSLTLKAFELFPNYPNPFNSKTIISYYLYKSSLVKIKIYNLNGQLLAVINEGIKTTGTHRLNFDASSMPSGIYIYTCETNQGMETKKFTILR